MAAVTPAASAAHAKAESWSYECDKLPQYVGDVTATGHCAAHGGAPALGKINRPFTIRNKDGSTGFNCDSRGGETTLPAKVRGLKCNGAPM